MDPGVKRMTQAEVVAVGQQFVAAQGFSLGDYERPQLWFNGDSRTWGLWFWGKDRVVGNYVLIMVDDETGRLELMPSR